MKKYELMALPYAPDALEPVISKETIGFHHGKHLQVYVDNLNGLTSPAALSPKGEGSSEDIETLEEIVRKAPAGPLFNNAGQVLNHEMYFAQFKPAGEAVQGPEGSLAAQIEKQWGINKYLFIKSSSPKFKFSIFFTSYFFIYLLIKLFLFTK